MKNSYIKIFLIIGLLLFIAFALKIGFKNPFLIKNLNEDYNLNVEISPSYKQISPGQTIWFTTKIMKFNESGRKDISLKYEILDSNKQVVSSKTETMAIETQASFVGSIKVPKKVSQGRYILEVQLLTDNQQAAIGSDSFEITTSENNSKETFLIYLLISVIGLILILMLILKSKKIIEKIKIKHRIKEIIRKKLNKSDPM